VNRVVFACVHNAGRSQMARAFFASMADPALVEAVSAGTAPGEAVHPEVVRAMAEVGIDLAGVRPQRLTAELVADAVLLVTMGCGDACPYVPGLEVEDWPLPDPKGRAPDAVGAIRDDLRARIEDLLSRRGWAS
jgi:arsenate reductase (thioredoxin)